MSGNFGIVGFLIGGVSFSGIMFTTAYSEWSRNSQVSSEQFLRGQYSYQGLWWRCISQRAGYFQCDNYDVSILGLDSEIQACRALMCIACIFSFFGVVISLMGLDCTIMVEPGTKSKNRVSLLAGVLFMLAADLQAQRALMVIAIVTSLFGLVVGMVSLRCTTMVDNEARSKSIIGIVSGACFLLAGVACGAAVSWFAWKVTMEFYNPLYQNREFKYEYGACLYVGWVCMALGACTLTTTIWFAVQVTQDYYDPMKASNSFKYEFGSCLYIGWICGGITILAGLLLTCGACGNLRSEPEESYPSYSYKPPQSGMKPKDSAARTEYV